MRKRWRDKYSAREARLDDSPTDMPVSLPGDELDAHEFDEDFNNPLLALGGSFEPLDASAGLELHEPSEQVEASFPPSAPVMPFRTAASDSRVKFVDKSLPSASSEPARFETLHLWHHLQLSQKLCGLPTSAQSFTPGRKAGWVEFLVSKVDFS